MKMAQWIGTLVVKSDIPSSPSRLHMVERTDFLYNRIPSDPPVIQLKAQRLFIILKPRPFDGQSPDFINLSHHVQPRGQLYLSALPCSALLYSGPICSPLGPLAKSPSIPLSARKFHLSRPMQIFITDNQIQF